MAIQSFSRSKVTKFPVRVVVKQCYVVSQSLLQITVVNITITYSIYNALYALFNSTRCFQSVAHPSVKLLAETP